MCLIQRYILFVGHPLYAAAAVIGGMLVLSGIGSYLSTGVPATRATLWKIAMVVALCVMVYGFVLTPLLHASLGLTLGLRVAVAFLLVTVPSLLMGMPFPLGLRYLGEGRNARIAWAWGINGCFSVVRASLWLMMRGGA